MEVAINPLDAESDMRPTMPLEFWKNAAIRFPLLSEIGRDAVGVAASSGSIERSFSTATDILSAKRNRMKPDLFARLMFIKCNSKLTWLDSFMSKKWSSNVSTFSCFYYPRRRKKNSESHFMLLQFCSLVFLRFDTRAYTSKCISIFNGYFNQGFCFLMLKTVLSIVLKLIHC